MEDGTSHARSAAPMPVDKCGKATRLLYDGNTVIAKRLYCGRWDCPRCASLKRKRWRDRILRQGLELARERGDPLGYWYREIDHQDYNKICKRLRRAEADYFAIVNDDHIGILTTKPLSPEDRFLSGKQLEEHVDHLLAQESALPSHHHRVRCSQSFSRDDRQSGGKWQGVAVAEDIKEVAQNFEQWGCKVSWKGEDGDEFAVRELTERAKQAMKDLFLPPSSPWDMRVHCPFTVFR